MASDNTILIVDDQESNRKILAGLLAQRGYHLVFADSGVEALEMVVQHPPDLILLDIMMPGIDGFEVCQRLKSSPQWQHIPIILVTALNSKEDLARGLDFGADDFLSRPLNRLELQARIRSMLRLKEQYDRLEAQKAQLEEVLQLRKDMSNMLVHDMKTPLTAIIGYSDLLLRTPEISAQGRQHLQAIKQGAGQLNRFANDLLLLAKTAQNKLQLNYSSVELNQLIIDVCDGHAITAQSKDLNLVTDLPSEPIRLSLDKDLFQRVLDNLVSNALKFSSTGGTVQVQLIYPSPANVKIRVLDQGPGIPPPDRMRIFDKFETVAQYQKEIAQMGLGLAFVKMVIEAHDGHIFITDNKPKGSVFTVEI